MIVKLKLRKVGIRSASYCPGKRWPRLNAGEGDALYPTETTDGGFRLTVTRPGFATKLKCAESLRRRYRHALKELAK